NLGIPLAPLRRARRKESVDTEWPRIGVVTKKLCAKRATDFQKVLAPPPSSNGHGTGGVGTAIESPTFSNRPQPWAALSWPENRVFRRSSKFSFVSPPNRSSKASEVQPISMRKLQRVVEVHRIHHRATLNLHASKSVRGQKGHLCPTFARCRTRTGLGSNFKVEIGSGPVTSYGPSQEGPRVPSVVSFRDTLRMTQSPIRKERV
ncbi:hypothetical protein Prudu_001542, partial [Prunus dulcis]